MFLINIPAGHKDFNTATNTFIFHPTTALRNLAQWITNQNKKKKESKI